MTAPDWLKHRLGGLRRFAIAITVFNILGHTLFGFEQSWLVPFVAVGTGYALELMLEWMDSWLNRRTPKFAGGFARLIDFLLPAHISALAISMLLYSNARVMPVVFATVVALGSKHIFRITLRDGRRCHFFNPSNFGITITLLTFHWVGIAPPYHFTEGLGSVGDWILPAFIIVSGSFLNWRFTKRLPLLGAWVSTFALQAVLRWAILGTSVTAAWLPMTGVAFILFTFYMVTDPPTTPREPRAQVLFGASVAAVYGMLMVFHVVFGLFFALSIVCAVRGAYLYAKSRSNESASEAEPAPVAAAGGAAGSGVPALRSAEG